MTREQLIYFLPVLGGFCRGVAMQIAAAFPGDEMWEARAQGIDDMCDEFCRIAEKMKEEGEND